MDSRAATTNDVPVNGVTQLRRRLPVVLGAVTGLILCGVFFAIVSLRAPHFPSPMPAAQALCGDLTTQNYAPLFSLLSTQQQGLGAESQFIASQKELDALRGPVNSCSTTLASQNASTAQVFLLLSRNTSAKTTTTVTFVFDGHAWRLASYDSTVV